MKNTLVVCLSLWCVAACARAPVMIGHRGARGSEPENTLRSFKHALDAGVGMIELDVHLAQSGEVVVIHDDTVDRTTNGKGSVHKLSWNKLKTYDAGKGEHIPLLAQVFDVVDQRAIINIEIKDPRAAQPVAQLIKQYVEEKQWSYDKFIVTSFDHYLVRTFKTYCPAVKTGVIFEGNPIGHADIARRAQADYAVLAYEWVTKAFVDDAHRTGIQVFAYTVNDAATAHKLKKLHVDGIITDYPGSL